MKIYESILDKIDAEDTPAASSVVSDILKKDLPNPYDDTDEFDLLLSIPVTSVDGKNYDKVIGVKERVYEFLNMHPAIISYSRILIGTWFHFFEGNPDVRHDISNRCEQFDIIFLVAIKMNFRTFLDVASFMTGLNSIVRGREARNAGIQFIKRDPETQRFYFDFKTWDEFILDKGVECSYFINDTSLKSKNRRLNGREFLDLVELCILLTKNHFTMNMYRKIYAGISFNIRERIFDSIMGNTMNYYEFPELREFMKTAVFDAYELDNKSDTENTSLQVNSYFRIIPINKIDELNAQIRVTIGHSRGLYTDKSNKMRNFLLEKLCGRSVESYQIAKIYMRGQEPKRMPVKLALWFGVDEIPEVDVPCAVLFILEISRPDLSDNCADFIRRFKNIFKTKPSDKLYREFKKYLMDDE